MKNISKALIVLLFLTGCRTAQHLPVQTVVETEIVETVRDSVVYVPADQATVSALLECDSLGNVLIKEIDLLQGKLNAKAKSASIKDNVISVECECDSLSIYLQLKDRYEKNKTVNTVFVEKELAWWQMTLIWLGVAFIITMFIVLIAKWK